MTHDKPQKAYLVEHIDGVARPFTIGDEIRVYEGTIVDGTATTAGVPNPDLDARRASAARDLPASIRRLDQLMDPVSRAVLNLHSRRPRFTTEWECSHCLEASDMGDNYAWPCDTVEAVAGVHGIDLTDFYLLDRPADGSLDHPETRP